MMSDVRRKKEEGRGKREDGRGKTEEGRSKREDGRGKSGFRYLSFLSMSSLIFLQRTTRILTNSSQSP